MSRNPVLPVRMWRLQPWNTNPLMRGSDRFEGTIRLLVVGLMLAMVPVAGAAGTARYSTSVDQIRVENTLKAQVSATVVAKPARVPSGNPYAADRFEAPVQWTRDNVSGAATVTVPESTAPGAAVQVWLRPDGKTTTAPKQRSAAVSDGVTTGLGILLLSWLGGLALAWSIGWALDIRRNSRWEAGWRQISRPVGT
ncbi:hypothetical protein [Nocardia sp. NPDC006630]|uniref:Rv1733c family protein n=1 Tax=Nocardia sp. NPDC006630 TaxID=3157181 RepID=UPI0033AEB239